MNKAILCNRCIKKEDGDPEDRDHRKPKELGFHLGKSLAAKREQFETNTNHHIYRLILGTFHWQESLKLSILI